MFGSSPSVSPTEDDLGRHMIFRNNGTLFHSEQASFLSNRRQMADSGGLALEESKEHIEDLVAKIRSASDALAAAFKRFRDVMDGGDFDTAALVDLYDRHENLRSVCAVNPARYCRNRPELFKQVDGVFSRAMHLLAERVAFPVSLRLTGR